VIIFSTILEVHHCHNIHVCKKLQARAIHYLELINPDNKEKLYTLIYLYRIRSLRVVNILFYKRF